MTPDDWASDRPGRLKTQHELPVLECSEVGLVYGLLKAVPRHYVGVLGQAQ